LLYHIAKAIGFSSFQNRIVRVQKLMQAIQMALAHPALEAEVKLRGLLEDLYKALDIETENILKTPEEKAEESAAKEEAMQRMIQAERMKIIDEAETQLKAKIDEINQELYLFNPALAERPQIVVLNKMDLPEARDRWPKVEAALQARELTAYAISAATGEGVHTLMAQVGQMLSSLPRPEPVAEEIPIFRFDETPEFVVEQEADGWRIRGERVERLAAQTMWQYHDAVQRAQRVLDAMGVLDALRQAGVEPGDTVRIGDLELEWLLCLLEDLEEEVQSQTQSR